jgi:phenylacetate-CoA ligase
VDPATGEVLSDGARGELVLTSLTKEAMPVIRYRTRDLTRLLPGSARTMRRMERITGRSDDMLIIRGINLFPTQIEELILADPRLAPHYVLEVRRTRRLDELKVVVEAKPAAADTDERAAAGEELARHIKSRLGVSAEIAVVEPGQVERSLGKAKRIIDLRPRE